MHFIGYGSCELNDDDEEDDNLVFFTFSGTDGPGADGAVIVTMDSGSDLNLVKQLTIKASVDGAASNIVQCAEG